MPTTNQITVLLEQARQCYQQSNFDNALALCDKIINIERLNLDALYQKGMVFYAMGRYQESIATYEVALTLLPHNIRLLNNKGITLLRIEKYENALACFIEALNIEPANAILHINMATALFALEKFDEALNSYNQALAIEVHNTQAITGRANLWAKLGYFQAALDDYLQVLKINPDSAEAFWAQTILSIVVDGFSQEIKFDFESSTLNKLHYLKNWCIQHRVSGEDVVGSYQLFNLSYKERNNKNILKSYGQLCCYLMSQWAINHQTIANNFSIRPIVRFGIVSADINNHSVWHAIIKNIIKYFNKTRFEIHLFYVGSKQTNQTDWAKHNVTYFEEGHHNLTAWVQSILSHSIDVLFYPAVGMDALTLQLASLRLSPIQLAGWGHPETTGLPSIDYYISGEAFEPPNAQNYYTEKLLMLPRIGTTYTPLQISKTNFDFSSFNICIETPILIASGIAIKYDPSYDYIFVEIAKRLKRCTFIFFKSNPLIFSEQLYCRLVAKFKAENLNFNDYGLFLPWQSIEAYFCLLKQADVFLDTIGFSGFNTVMHAIECELPIVTKECAFMRGRFGSGILKSANLGDIVCTTEHEYIDMAVKLATDTSYRNIIKKKIKQSQAILFDNIEPINKFEEMLTSLTNNKFK